MSSSYSHLPGIVVELPIGHHERSLLADPLLLQEVENSMPGGL